MKKWMSLAVCLVLLMLCGAAAASMVEIDPADKTGAITIGERTFTPVPVDQYNLIVPDGMRFESVSKKPGEISLVIRDQDNANDPGTNWLTAIAHTGTGWGDAQIIYQVKVPKFMQENASSIEPTYLLRVWGETPEDVASTFSYNEGNNDENTDYLQHIDGIDGWGVACEQNPWGDLMPIAENGMNVATSIPEIDYLIPQNCRDQVWFGWYDENKQPLGYQWIDVSIGHTVEDAFSTNVSNPVSPYDIIADSTKESTKSGSTVTYILPNPGDEAFTKVKVPVGATNYVVHGTLKSGDKASGPIPPDGYITLSTRRQGWDIHSEYWCITFTDPNGFEEMVSLTIKYQSSNNVLPWVGYESGFIPMAEADILIDNGAENAGYVLNYNVITGQLDGNFDGEAYGGAPGTVTISMRVPTDEIASYRVVGSGGNHLLGKGTHTTSELDDQFNREYPNGPLPVTGDSVVVDVSEPFRKIVPRDDDITIYIPDFRAKVDGHIDLYTVRWYKQDGTLFGGSTFYFWQTLQDFVLAQSYVDVLQLKDLKEEVTQPTVVVPNGQPFEDLKLAITAYITEGQDTWLYDLTLQNANGQPAKPNTPVWVYLPFPEGHTSGQKYKINHYTDGLYDSTNLSPAERLEVEETLYGLVFQTSSFSPFILSVDDSAPATPPRTGDHTPLAWLLAAAGVSACGMLLMRRKTRKA